MLEMLRLALIYFGLLLEDKLQNPKAGTVRSLLISVCML